MIFKKTLKDIINNRKTTFNNTEINHNYHTNIETLDNSNTFNTSQTNNHLEQKNYTTNIDTVDNSNTFNTSQTNNHLEQINNVTNIGSKQSIHKKQKENDANSSKKTINNLSEEQLKKIYNFFIDNELLANINMTFEEFNDTFLIKPLRLKMEVPSLREFYNNLKLQKNVIFKNINNDFLTKFINAETNETYDYKQFSNYTKSTSKLSDQILKLFEKF